MPRKPKSVAKRRGKTTSPGTLYVGAVIGGTPESQEYAKAVGQAFCDAMNGKTKAGPLNDPHADEMIATVDHDETDTDDV